jgi:plasmid maintenance system antidote protein VapI
MKVQRYGKKGKVERTIHNPPYPGEFITSVYLEPFGVSGRELSYRLDVAPSTLSRIPATIEGVES